MLFITIKERLLLSETLHMIDARKASISINKSAGLVTRTQKRYMPFRMKAKFRCSLDDTKGNIRNAAHIEMTALIAPVRAMICLADSVI